MTRATSTLLLSGLLAVFATAAMAQAPAAADGKPAMEHRMGHRDPAKMQEMVAKHLAELKTKLAITPAQESAWATFAAAMQPPATRPARPTRPTREEMAALTTPERIDKLRTLRAQHQSIMDARADATKAFYGVLSADQKKTFDAASLRMMGRHGGKGGHGHR